MLAAAVIAASSAAAFAPGVVTAGPVSSPAITMNAANNANVKFNAKSGNKGLYGWQVKKNSKTGDTANLRGYRVGSRAPPMSISSGTTIAQSNGRYNPGYGYKGKYTVPGFGGDAGLDLRSFEGGEKKELFVHRSNMLTEGGEGKDCFINRAKAGPIAATNPIFIHSGVWHSDAGKD